jgi:hypothetical protein
MPMSTPTTPVDLGLAPRFSTTNVAYHCPSRLFSVTPVLDGRAA